MLLKSHRDAPAMLAARLQAEQVDIHTKMINEKIDKRACGFSMARAPYICKVLGLSHTSYVLYAVITSTRPGGSYNIKRKGEAVYVCCCGHEAVRPTCLLSMVSGRITPNCSCRIAGT